MIFHDVGAAAAPPYRAVVDIDFAGVEEIDQGLTPAPLAAGTIRVAIADGRVADQEEGRKLWICRGIETNLCVSGRVGGGAFHRNRLSGILCQRCRNGNNQHWEN